MNVPKIHVSLTSMSSRMATVHKTLRSLIDQDHDDFVVHLYLSKEPYLLDEGVPEIPDTVQALIEEAQGKLKVHYTTNIGPYRKLLPFLSEHWGLEVLVVTADDDTIYPPHWLETLFVNYEKYRCCIAFRGHRIVTEKGKFRPYRSWMKDRIFENPSNLILPTGKDGILYNSAMFPETVMDVDRALQLARTADDMWFRWNLAMNGVPLFVVETDYTNTFEESSYESSLYLNFNRGGQNDVVVEALSQYFKKSKGFDLVQEGVL